MGHILYNRNNNDDIFIYGFFMSIYIWDDIYKLCKRINLITIGVDNEAIQNRILCAIISWIL